MMTDSIERKNKVYALTGSILVHAILIFLLLFAIIRTPIPPFETPEGFNGFEVAALGEPDAGSGNSTGDKKGDENQQDSKTNVPPSEVSDDGALVNDAETSIPLPEKKKKIEKTPEPVKTETKPQPSSELLKMIELMKNRKGKNKGGKGPNETEGTFGSPDGIPGGEGLGGNDGNDPKPSGKGYSYELSGRSVAKRPQHDEFATETGQVVVEILVDEKGNVVDATPGVRGSTTTSSVLKARANQAARSTKFNPLPGARLQKGTITFIFSY